MKSPLTGHRKSQGGLKETVSERKEGKTDIFFVLFVRSHFFNSFFTKFILFQNFLVKSQNQKILKS